MRNVVIAALYVGMAGSAAAKPVDPKPAKPIDMKPAEGKLDVFKDELGNYYVTPKPKAFDSTDDENKWV